MEKIILISTEDACFIVNDLVESAERAWDHDQHARLMKLAHQLDSARTL